MPAVVRDPRASVATDRARTVGPAGAPGAFPLVRPTWHANGDELADRAIDAYNDWCDSDLRTVRHLLRLDGSLGARSFDALLRALQAVRLGDRLRAITCLVEAEQVGARTDDPRLAIELGLATGYVLLAVGEPLDAVGALDHVWATAPGVPDIRRRTALLLAEATSQLGDGDEAAAWWHVAVDAARAVGPSAEAVVMQGVAHGALRCAATLGPGDQRDALVTFALEALDLADDRVRAVESGRDDRTRRRGRLLTGEALVLSGRADDARIALEDVVSTTRDPGVGADDLLPRAHLLLLHIERAGGDLVAAARHGQRGVAACIDPRFDTTLTAVALAAAAVHDLAGDAVAALRCRRMASDVEARRSRARAEPDALVGERQRHQLLRGARSARWHGATKLAATLEAVAVPSDDLADRADEGTRRAP